MDINQIGILILSPLAIFLVSCKTEKIRRWAYITGFLSQPFWFWAAFTTKQWGILIVAVVYTLSWIKGIWNFWINPAFEDIKNDWKNDSRV